MLQFLKSTQLKICLVVLCALLFGAVFAVVSQNGTSPVTKAVSVVFTPLQKATGYLSEKLRVFGASFASANAYRAENEALRARVAEYEAQMVDYDEIKHKITSYEEMLGIKASHSDYTLAPANIIGADATDLFSSLIIDKGSNDDIAVNDPVICGNYLVGIVKKVNPTHSVVLSLLNPQINVSAIESKTRETAYVTTDTDRSRKGKCVMAGLERTTLIAPGGIVTTSGIGGIYPKGLIIGTVTQVLESDVDLTSYAIVEPGADLQALEDVFVITGFRGQGIE